MWKETNKKKVIIRKSRRDEFFITSHWGCYTKESDSLELFNHSSCWCDLPLRQIFSKFFFSKQSIATLTSVIFHFILILILLSIVVSSHVGIIGNSTEFSFIADVNDKLGVLDSELDVRSYEITLSTDDPENYTLIYHDELETFPSVYEPWFDEQNLGDSGHENLDRSEMLNFTGDSGNSIPFYTKKGTTKDRSQAERRGKFIESQRDITNESEDAVERGLEWLARHQLPDGGWTFDLTETDSNGHEGTCGGRCSNSFATSGGSEYKGRLHPSRTAATAIALLPFLGAGYTHTELNKYQRTVASGLRFLMYNAQFSNEYGVDFRAGFRQDGAAYIQALAVLTCCEAYEMTRDPNLKSLAQGGVKKIEISQLNDGGWRYYFLNDTEFHAGVHGDTSVLGWQMLALKSGISAGFTVHPSVAYKAGNFLDLVMSKDGTSYRYQPTSSEIKAKTWGTTAVGVLIREYLGWQPGNPRLDSGIKQIAKWIDDSDLIWQKVKKGIKNERARLYIRDGRLVYNLYFAYYSALALHHYGGTLWKIHFSKLRSFLVETQVNETSLGKSCEQGSWLFYDLYMNDGGRLLNTALAVLILETPYRYLPMYQ